MKRLPQTTIDEIIKLYQTGITPTNIAAQFGIRNNSVTRLLRKNGILRNQLIRTSQQTIQIILQDYANGISSEIIAKKLNINGSTVCRILKRNGIAIRPATQNKRKYTIVQDFFSVIDTEAKAYFLGLMYADGSLSQGGSGIKITLQEIDKDILEVFSNIIYGFVKLRRTPRELEDGRIVYDRTFNIYCERMHQDLCKLGCPPAKTFDIRLPTSEMVPTHLMPHFVRGYFDGDGCICITNPARPRIDFSSNGIFIDQLIEYLTANGIRCNRPGFNEKNPLSGNVQLTCPDNVVSAYEFLYKDATIYMKRKHNTFQQMFCLLEEIKLNKYSAHKNIDRYGTTYIPEYNGILLLGKNLKGLSDQDKDAITNQLFNFYRKGGFPYADYDDNELIKAYLDISNTDPKIIEHTPKVLENFNVAGLNLVKQFSPHFYEANSGLSDGRMSMLDTFNDDELLKKAIKNRLTDNFNMTGNMLKQGLANAKLAYKASVYNPMVAKYIYQHHTQPGDIVYDYSMGFGQRLLAALSLEQPITYVGVDPMQKQVNSNWAIYNFLNNSIPMFNRTVDLQCVGSENYCDPKYQGKVALAFSCPPYFNVEKYENDPGQAYADGSYINFINIWWRKSAQNIIKLLKDDGVLALQVQDVVDGFNLGKDMCNVLREYGMELFDQYKVQITRNTSFGRPDGTHKYEMIYLFRKS